MQANIEKLGIGLDTKVAVFNITLTPQSAWEIIRVHLVKKPKTQPGR